MIAARAEARAIANAAHKAEADAHTASVAPLIAEAQAAAQADRPRLERAGRRHSARGQVKSATVANVLKRVAA